MDKQAMEEVAAKTAIYPGCTLDGTASSFLVSLQKVLQKLNFDCGLLDEWNCCGASSAHALSHSLHLSLSIRNLSLAEAQGFDEVLAPCAACYHRLASADTEFHKDPEVPKLIRSDADLSYSGSVKIRNVLDFLVNRVGVEAISEAVVDPLSEMKIVSYYGCLNTRIPRRDPYEDVECPVFMDQLVEAAGAEPVDWSHRTECCGASLFATDEPVSAGLVSVILKDAVARNVDCIAVACPMCHNNLDTKQADVRRKFNIARPVPVLFITQLIGLALGIPAAELELNHNFVPFERPSGSVA